MRLAFTQLIMALLMIAPSMAIAKDNLLFILDASNSMWGQVDGVAKIQTAKLAFKNLLSDIPDNVHVGLGAYGHTNKTSCTDVGMLLPFVDKAGRGQLTDAIDGVTPTGKTPIAEALNILGVLVNTVYGDQNNSIVLISDGLETCGGDPCSVAARLAADGIDMRVHVVGFDISDKDREQLECIAENGNGNYFAANSTADFQDAVAKVVKVATKPQLEKVAVEPAPLAAEPKFKEVFRDDFDGDELADHWEIVNPNPDAFVVEDGELLVLSAKPAALQAKDKIDAENFFKLNTDLPKGDWRLTAKIRVPFQTLREFIRIGILEKPDKHIAANVFVGVFASGYYLYLQTGKRTGEDYKFFDETLVNAPNDATEAKELFSNPFLIQLEKSGRSYTAKFRNEKDKPGIWRNAGSLTVLRAKGVPFISFSQGQDVSGETENFIDWVKIEVPE